MRTGALLPLILAGGDAAGGLWVRSSVPESDDNRKQLPPWGDPSAQRALCGPGRAAGLYPL